MKAGGQQLMPFSLYNPRRLVDELSYLKINIRTMVLNIINAIFLIWIQYYKLTHLQTFYISQI